MFTAKQYIAELTLIVTIPTIFHVVFMWYVVTHPGDWLLKYGLWVSFIGILPNVIVCIRALQIFPECKFRSRYLIDFGRLRQLGAFATWQTFGMLSALLRVQGTAILVNKYFGPRINSALNVSRQIDTQALSLSTAMEGALHPAITTACGMGDMKRMISLSYRASKLGMVFLLVFALPLCIEVKAVLNLWLENPPPYSAGLCILFLVMLLIEKSTVGHMLALNAYGKIALYQAVVGTMALLVLPMSWLFVEMGLGVYSIGYASVISAILSSIGRVIFAKHLLHMSMRYWFWRIICPVGMICACTVCFGLMPSFFMSPGFLRIVVTALFSEAVYIGLTWFFMLDQDERNYVTDRVRRMFPRKAGNE